MSRVLKHALLKTPAYPFLKYLYRHTVRRDYLVARAGLEAFYRPLIREGNLVFDVGANHGDLSDAYLRLGARVVAIEPHPGCAVELKSLYGRNRRFELVQAALGAFQGEAELFLGENGMDNVSTVSADYIKEAGRVPGLAVAGWSRSVTVRQDTLDSLISKFGLPDFCKIDVEGYEIDVLAGVSQPLPLLQFEYQPWAIEKAVDCTRRLSQLGMSKFNITLSADRQTQPELRAEWIDAQSMIQLLRETANKYVGDVFVMR